MMEEDERESMRSLNVGSSFMVNVEGGIDSMLVIPATLRGVYHLN